MSLNEPACLEKGGSAFVFYKVHFARCRSKEGNMICSRLINEIRRHQGVFSLLCLAGLSCAVPVPAVSAAELKADLVKRTWGGAPASFLTGQVQLTFPDGRTKLLKYRLHLRPVVKEGKVYIFTTKDAEVTGIFVYDSAKGRGQSFLLPADLKLNFYFGQPSFSPDGTKVAYYFDPRLEKQPRPEKKQYERRERFIDRTGKTVTAPTTRGQIKSRPRLGEFSEGLARLYEEKVGFKDASGEKIKFIKSKVGFKDLTGKVLSRLNLMKQVTSPKA
jgi:hypothetical protein